MYIVFTNQYKGSNRRYFQNENRFVTHTAKTKTEVETIIEKVKSSGYCVTNIKDGLGFDESQNFNF